MGGPASIARVVHMILQRDTRPRGFYAPRLPTEPPTGPRTGNEWQALLVIRLAAHDLERTVHLLEQDHASKVVRERDAPERKPLVGTSAHLG